MQPKQFVIKSRQNAKFFISDVPWVGISISTFPGDWPKLNMCQRVGLLQQYFADLDRDHPNIEQAKDAAYVVGIPDETRYFSKELADQILDFAAQYWDKVEVILVHCEAGRCRSPAIAAALSKIYYNDDMAFFKQYTPNMFVYRTIMQAAADRNLIR